MEIQDQIRHMDNQLLELSKKVDKLNEALIGTEFTEGKGLIHTVKDHEKRIIDLENVSISNKTYMNILRFIAGVVTTGVLSFIVNLILKH